MSATEIARKAKIASEKFRACTEIERTAALEKISKILLTKKREILSANKKDVDNARKYELSEALIDRLALSDSRIDDISNAVLKIIELPEVCYKIIKEDIRPNGLVVQRQRVPLGVIGMIFESRPNVVVDASALAIKSGNAIILKGGKEAKHTNEILFLLIQEAIKYDIPEDIVQLVASREDIAELIKLNEYIDLIIPRGGEGLVEYISTNSTVPVVAHYKGVCHTYIHLDAEMEKAKEIVLNAKTSRPGVCNAMESLVVNVGLGKKNIAKLLDVLVDAGVVLKGEENKYYSSISSLDSEGYSKEYLEKKLSVKFVSSIDEAIDHISIYGSNHTEAIVSNDSSAIEFFKNRVDASCVIVNASTRFNDGGELGIGAEIGISTTKVHAYGPMGIEGLTTVRYLVVGDGQIRK